MGSITVIGVGCGAGDLTEAAVDCLNSGKRIVLHTGRCYCGTWLENNGIAFETLDYLYESCEDFDEHAASAAKYIEEAAISGDVAYCVMDVRDKSARLLTDNGARAIPGLLIEGELWAYASAPVAAFAAAECEDVHIDSNFSALVREVDSREMACDLKLRLMSAYPDDVETLVKTRGGIARIPLYKLDRLAEYDHETAVLVAPVTETEKKSSFSLDDAVALSGKNSDECRAMDFDEAVNELERLSAGASYAETHGEYDMREVLYALCKKLLAGNH